LSFHETNPISTKAYKENGILKISVDIYGGDALDEKVHYDPARRNLCQIRGGEKTQGTNYNSGNGERDNSGILPKKLSLDYIAGFTDGESCFTF